MAEGDTAEEAVKNTTNFFAKQIKPWGDGKLWRNLGVLGIFACVSGVTILSGGTAVAASLPFNTTLAGAFNTAALAPTNGILPAAWSLTTEFFAHAGNGIYYTGTSAYEFLTGVDWNAAGEKVSNAYNALQGPE